VLVRTRYWGPNLRRTNAASPKRCCASEEIGRIDPDIQTLQVITFSEIKHAMQDTPEWEPTVVLEQIGRGLARIIDQVNQLGREQLLPAL